MVRLEILQRISKRPLEDTNSGPAYCMLNQERQRYSSLSSDQLLRSPVIGRLTLNTEPYSGACFGATNVFSFEALFANNPFWCLKRKHVSNSRLGKIQPNH